MTYTTSAGTWGYEPSSYAANLNCVWTILPYLSKSVSLVFSSLSTRPSDYVAVTSYINTAGTDIQMLGLYSGAYASSRLPSIVSSTGRIQVAFSTGSAGFGTSGTGYTWRANSVDDSIFLL